MVGDVAAAVGLDARSAPSSAIGSSTRDVRPIVRTAQREDVRVLEQEQVVVGVGEQRALERQRVGVGDPAEPAGPQGADAAESAVSGAPPPSRGSR